MNITLMFAMMPTIKEYGFMKHTKQSLSYDNSSDAARFREQYRFAFSAVVIASVFVAPNGNALEQFFKLTLETSAFFSALYLIASAALVKYKEPGRLYVIFGINEGFRMWAYDWSVHVFAAALLLFISLLITGILESLLGVKFGEIGLYMSVVLSAAIIGLMILLIQKFITSRNPRKKKYIPSI
jgi:hypothetical protein